MSFKLNRSELNNSAVFPTAFESNQLIRIVSANVKRFYPDWQKRSEKIAKIFSMYKPDVVAFQEIDQEGAESIQHLLNGEYQLEGKYNAKNGHFSSILFKKDITFKKADYFWISQSKQEIRFLGSKFPHIVTYYNLRKNSKDFVIANTHYHSGADPRLFIEGSKIVVEQINKISQRLQQPIILAGDFNLFPGPNYPGEEAYKILSKIGKDVRDSENVSYFGPDGTFRGMPGDKWATPMGQPPKERLDHMFLKGEISAQNAGVLTFDEPLPSDHYFLIGDFILSEQPTSKDGL